MSDKKAGGDVAAEQAAAPIKPAEVKVTVRPQQENLPKKGDPARAPAERRNADNKQRADRATGGAAKEIREAVREAASKGREAQKDAAKRATADVGAKLPSNVFKDVQVEIPGEKPITVPANEGGPAKPPKT